MVSDWIAVKYAGRPVTLNEKGKLSASCVMW